MGVAAALLAATPTVAFDAVFNGPADVPAIVPGFTAAGQNVSFSLNFVPDPGTQLMVVQNTGLSPIEGTFENLAQGESLRLDHHGNPYYFVADYFGGNGNDLVLVWKKNRLIAWGSNGSGALGIGTTGHGLTPVPVVESGVLSGKTILDVAAGTSHSVVLCSDGTVAAWGFDRLPSPNTTVPTLVDNGAGSALFGKRVVGVAAGEIHSLALCADGTVATWGFIPSSGGFQGLDSFVPVAVDASPSSALHGRKVISVAAGRHHDLALCSDGALVTWGSNDFGQLGIGEISWPSTPQWVTTQAGVSYLSGKTVVAIEAGPNHNFALCSDGTVAAWGENIHGELGTEASGVARAPMAVMMGEGSPLFGKVVREVTAGEYFNAALCSDGTLVNWGWGLMTPVNAEPGSALFQKTPSSLSGGSWHGFATCTDGSIAAWGENDFGQLGDGTTTDRPIPVGVDLSALRPGEIVTTVSAGGRGVHALAVVASPYGSEISIGVEGMEIPTGSSVPNVLNDTDFGTAEIGGAAIVRTFTIRNTGEHDLHLTGTPRVEVSGPGAQDFMVNSPPSSTVARDGGTTTFEVAFAPTGLWLRTAVITVPNDDSDKGAYHFEIQGTATGTLAAVFTSEGHVPLSTRAMMATGSSVNLALGYAPVAGTALRVVDNTGIAFIDGTFDNLEHGQEVPLSFQGSTYYFVANYFGGTGNDLVLEWGNNRPFAWGANNHGQLGDGSTTSSSLPRAVDTTGALAGKKVWQLAGGLQHSLALCSDGTVAAWGAGISGVLGNGTPFDSLVPTAVNADPGTSALAGKKVVSVAAGSFHSLALCDDGTVAAWGENNNGSLGDGTSRSSLVPVAVNTEAGVSALHGKSVVAIAAGTYHSVALCSDGTLAAWGSNGWTSSDVPLAVGMMEEGSALLGKQVVAITAGRGYSLALCSDGSVVGWGDNHYGTLGTNNTTTARLPVAVNTDPGLSALSGKTVVAISACENYALALCADGTLAAWGTGINTSHVPVAVSQEPGVSALADRTVSHLAAGHEHWLAHCLDGTIVAWGANNGSQLGIGNQAPQEAPVLTSTPNLIGGERFAGVAAGYHSLALAGTPFKPDIGLAGQGRAIPNGGAPPSLLNHTDFGSAAAGSGRITRTFTITNSGDADLRLTGSPRIEVSGPQATEFTVTLPPTDMIPRHGGTATFEVTFAPTGPWLRTANLTVANDDPDEGSFQFPIQGVGQETLWASYTTGAEIPLTVPNGIVTTGSRVNFAFAFEPRTGTELMVIDNRGSGFINGAFEDLGPGQSVDLTYAGTTHAFVANYSGGDGNDLVLSWKKRRLLSWGNNRSRPVNIPMTTGVLAGKTVIGLAAGQNHSVVLSADGTLSAWGLNNFGQLGNGTSNNSSTPAAVSVTEGVSALAGKRVVAVTAGGDHTLALCSDGSVAAWGLNSQGQLGNGTSVIALSPVWVETNSPRSALFGKDVAAMAAGESHSVVICTDGTLCSWGSNLDGRLGVGPIPGLPRPMPVDATSNASALLGRTAVRLAAGQAHTLALCSDGTVVGWGSNTSGQLGDATTSRRSIPTAVDVRDVSSALFGKTVVAIAAGAAHSLALINDGTVAAWGSNTKGQLGDNTTINRLSPVAVNTNPGESALAGKRVVAVAAGRDHSLALCSDGVLVAWGNNAEGQAGNTTTINSTVPVVAGAVALADGEVFTRVASGPHSTRVLALTAGSTIAPLERWRQLWFGAPENSGNGADAADPDKDGFTNVLEWAFALNPLVPDSWSMEEHRVGNSFELTYSRGSSAFNAGAVFQLESSRDLRGGRWDPVLAIEELLADNGVTQQVKIKVTPQLGFLGRWFFRLKVAAP